MLLSLKHPPFGEMGAHVCMDLRTAAYSVQLLLVSLALERLGHFPALTLSLLLVSYCPLSTAQLARRRQTPRVSSPHSDHTPRLLIN